MKASISGVNRRDDTNDDNYGNGCSSNDGWEKAANSCVLDCQGSPHWNQHDAHDVDLDNSTKPLQVYRFGGQSFCTHNMVCPFSVELAAT